MNPFASEEIAAAMHKAISMPAAERQRRMSKMRVAVSSNNIYRWAGKIIQTLSDVELGAAGDVRSKPDEAFELVGAA